MAESPDTGPTADTEGPAAEAGPEGTADVPAELRRAFWFLVVVFNAALLGVGLGLLLLVFERGPDLGVELLGAGLLLGAYGYLRYRYVRRRLGPDERHP